MAIDGQATIVTGAGSGLGRAIALQLAREGADVAVVDLNGEAAEATATAVRELGRRALAIAVDVRDKGQVQAMAERVRGEWGRIDVLVACAGIFQRAPIDEMSEDIWDRHLEIHAKGTFLCVQAVLPAMKAQRHGRIVTTVSGLAGAGDRGTGAYAAAKGAIISFTKVLARETMEYGITANAFGPGPTRTPLLFGAMSPDEVEAMDKTAMGGRLPTPEQGAELAIWFTRPETVHITGRIFVQS